MFLKSVTELPVDFEAVRATMTDRARPWLTQLAEAAGDDCDRYLVDVGVPLGHGRLTRPSVLQVGDQAALGDRVVSLPLRLRIADHAELFPALQGSLDAAWLGADRTHLALAVQYEPPFGLLGRVADGVVLHRIAELVVQHLLEAIAGRLGVMCAT